MAFRLEKAEGLDVYVLKENGKPTKYKIKMYRAEYRTTCVWWKVFSGEKSLGTFETREEAVFFLKRRLLSDMAGRIAGSGF